MKERIQKVLSAAGVDSRRHVEEMVRQGRVAVNGRVMTELPILVDPQVDRITIDDEQIKIRPKHAGPMVYVLLNKPRNVVATNVAQGEQRRAIDLLPRDFPRVYPVGRLDHESRGLLLLTNDGDLTHRLTHPRYEVTKAYVVTVDGAMEPETVEKLRRGVWLADPRKGTGFKTGRSQIRIVSRERNKTVMEIAIREGRSREVRRIMAKLGHKVRDVLRSRFGPLTLDGVSNGKWRLLTPGEIKKLQSAGETPHEPKPFAPSLVLEEGEQRQPERRAAKNAGGRNPNQLKL